MRTAGTVCALGAGTARLRLRWRARFPCILFALIIAVLPLPALAQTPNTDNSGSATGTGTFGGGLGNSGNTAAGSGSDLLTPSLDNPNTPQRFRKPGQTQTSDQTPPVDQFAPNRIGTTPTYGSPNGFGAGDTGFDSMNTSRSKKKKKTPAVAAPGAVVPQAPQTTFTPVPSFTPAAPNTPPPQAKEPPPDVYPKRAAARPGATLPAPPDDVPISNPTPEIHPLVAASRPGATLPTPLPEQFNYAANPPPITLPPINTLPPGTVPQRLLPIAAADPYAALGIHAGSFYLFPSLDLSAAYTSNAEHGPGSPGTAYFITAPELKVQSDWNEHSLSADILGSYTWYTADLTPSLDVPFLNSKVDFRYDVTRDTAINTEVRYLINTDNPGSPNLQAQLARLPLNYDAGGTLGVAEQLGRLSFSLKGTFDRATYDQSVLADGTTSSNSDRNFDQYAGIGRVSYELDPGLKPYVEVEADQRIHDEQFDRSGLQRDSTGNYVMVGTTVDRFGTLTGEMGVGYVDRVYRDPTLPNINGIMANGTVIWQPTGLTTAKLSATSQIYETVLAGASGEFSRDLNLEVDHAFRSWLIGILKTGWGNDTYTGLPLLDNRYFVSVGINYKFTREFSISAQIREDWQFATESSFSYQATSVLLGVHLQR